MRTARGILLLIGTLVLPAAAQAETARAFVDRIYAGYAREDFNPLNRLDAYFAPEIAAQIRKDSAGGEVGYLDGDPLCDCQDYSGLKARVESVAMHGKQAADARILLDLGSADERSVELHLVLTEHGWRVADVGTKEEPSLLEALRRSNRAR